MAVSSNVAACRARFPIFERLVYINSCSQGALSDSVRAAYDEYLTGWDDRGAPWDYWVERTEAGISADSFALIGHDAPVPAVRKPDGKPLRLGSNEAWTITPTLSQNLPYHMT